MSAVNPILVVMNNLPDYARELHDERIKLQDKLSEIDRQMEVLAGLADVLGIDIGTTERRRAEKSAETVVAAPAPDRLRGRVKWFNESKGYGHIEVPGDPLVSDDVFVHFTAIKTDGYRFLIEGQQVEFSITRSEKGPVARDVVVL